MRIKFKLARGNAVMDMKSDNETLKNAVKILCDPDVISMSVVKMTPKQYFDSRRKSDNRPTQREVE